VVSAAVVVVDSIAVVVEPAVVVVVELPHPQANTTTKANTRAAINPNT
jgi:hypothetical protein